MREIKIGQTLFENYKKHIKNIKNNNQWSSKVRDKEECNLFEKSDERDCSIDESGNKENFYSSIDEMYEDYNVNNEDEFESWDVFEEEDKDLNSDKSFEMTESSESDSSDNLVESNVSENGAGEQNKVTSRQPAFAREQQSISDSGEEESSIDLEKYNTDEWESVERAEKKGFFGRKSYTYTAPDGSTVKVSNTDNIDVKVNSNTGEMVVIGANQASIDLSKNANITIVESTVKDINAKSGGETITVQGAHTNVEKINGGKGDQNITVNLGANVEKISTGNGNDSIKIDNAIAGKVKSGLGDDNITIKNSDINGKIKSGIGNDNITIADNSAITGKVKSGLGNDNITIDSSNISGKVKTGFGDNTINIFDSTVSSDAKIKMGWGNNTLNASESNINGKVTGSRLSGDLKINATNSIMQNVKNLNAKSTTINSTDSAIKGIDSIQNYNRTVTSLDTSKGGEYEGYSLVNPSKINAENNQTAYEINGTTVWIDSDDGEIYTNKNGDIIINGANNVSISSDKSANITALNSNIVSHNNLQGKVTYKNSIVDGVYIANSNSEAIINADGSNIDNVNIDNNSATVNITNGSNIEKIQGNSSKSDIVSVQADNGNINNINLKGDLGLQLTTTNASKKSTIGSVQTDEGSISANLSNAQVSTLKTKNGSIDIKAKNSTVTNVINKNTNGTTDIDFHNVTLNAIKSKSPSTIKLDNCTVNSKIKTSNGVDNISINNSTISKINTGLGNDNLDVAQSEVKKITVSGTTTIYASDVDKINASGDIALLNSEVDSLNLIGNNDNLYSKNSILPNNKDSENSQTSNNTNLAEEKIQAIEAQQAEGIYSILEEMAPDEVASIIAKNPNLSKAEIVAKISENPSNDILAIKDQLASQLQGSIKNLEDENKNKKSTLGNVGTLEYFIDNPEDELEEKKAIVNKAIESGDLTEILNAYSLLNNKSADAESIENIHSSLTYAKSLDDNEINQIIKTLGYIGNDLEYQMTSQDGVIKDAIAKYNNLLDIGTTRNEVKANLATFRANVAALQEKFESGNLTKEEFVAEYKRITGNDLTKSNVKSLTDTIRGNDEIDTTVQEKITDYQNTQQTVFQATEYTATIVAGAAVTIASFGAAGPAVASALASLGTMGVALTSTTVSFIAKTAIDAAERQTNAIASDDLTTEEVAKSAALMYAGCLCGQFGNAVGNLVSEKTPEMLAKFISSQDVVNIASKTLSKTSELTADSLSSAITTAMITGDGSFSEEFYQNLQSEAIGLIQSKITGAYFNNHPELSVKAELYNARKGLEGVAETQANAQILKQFGFSESDIKQYSNLKASEVDALVSVKKVQDYCATTLNEHGIDTSKLSGDEALNQGKIVGDLYANKTVQGQEAESVLNAINDNSALLEGLTSKIEYKADSDTYKIQMFGDDFEVQVKQGENLMQKMYEAYQAKNGDNGCDFTEKVLNEINSSNDSEVKFDKDSSNSRISSDAEQKTKSVGESKTTKGGYAQGKAIDSDYNRRLQGYKIDNQKSYGKQSHKSFTENNKILNEMTKTYVTKKDQYGNSVRVKNPDGTDRQSWRANIPNDRTHGAWKMHIYADNETDWQKLVDTCGKYLSDRDVEWKTFGPDMNPETFGTSDGGKQHGKAFTFYPKNQAEMEQVARDLDSIIRANGLNTDNSKIIGDNELGSTGRLFYRYEYKSGSYIGKEFDLNSREQYRTYDKYYYDGNSERQHYYEQNPRQDGGEYLAKDMKLSDDPWRNFDPSNPNSKPGINQNNNQNNNQNSSSNTLKSGQNIGRGKGIQSKAYKIDPNSVLKLGNSELDLSNPRIQQQLAALKDGQRLLIGRGSNNNINTDNFGGDTSVSGKHAGIYKLNGTLYLVDEGSTNGTSFIGDGKYAVQNRENFNQYNNNNQNNQNLNNRNNRNNNKLISGQNIGKGKGIRSEAYEFNPNSVLQLGDLNLDLTDKRIQSQLANLQNGQRLTIGRGENNNINTDEFGGDRSVSQTHAGIYKYNGKYYLVDEGSTNGTKLLGTSKNSSQTKDKSTLGFEPLVLRHRNGEETTYNISRSTFEKLFPTTDGKIHSNSTQQDNGDCYLLSTINALFDSSAGKNTIINCFTQKADGSLQVKLPNGTMTFDANAAMREINKNPEMYSQTSPGVQLLEYAYQQERFAKAMDIKANGIGKNFGIFTEYVEDALIHKEQMGENIYDPISFRSMGFAKEVMAMFGYESETYYSPSGIAGVLSNSDSWNNNVYTIATKRTPGGGGDDTYWNKKLDIAGSHEYMIKPRIDNSGKIVVDFYNPWHSESVSCTLTPEQIVNSGYFDRVEVTKVR